MKRTFYIALLSVGLFFIFSFPAFSQILDDSTKLVYGAYTTYYTTFDRLKNNNYLLTKIDTLVDGLHNFDYVSKGDYKYQDLGVIGTSIRPIYYEPTEQIGARSGFDSYSHYYLDKENITFFDSKSPYTLINASFGGGRRSMTTVKHARNITPYWNAGFHFRRMSIEKQINSSGRNDRQVVSTAYYFHTHYQAPSEKYVGLLAFSRSNHEVQENGGVDSVGFLVFPGDYFDPDANVNLENAESTDLRLDFITYHEYKWKRPLNIYLFWEQIGNKYKFEDFAIDQAPDNSFFDQVLINPDSTTDRVRYRQSIYEGGIKGTYGGFYYNLHVKLRKVNYLEIYLPDEINRWESYGGFNLRFDFDSLKNHSIDAKGEYLVAGGYFLRGDYTNKYFSATYQRTRYQPTIMQESYFGNHDEWYNDFDPINSDYIRGKIDFNLKNFHLSPRLTLINLNHNVYFNEEGIPEQAGGNVQLLHPALKFDLHMFNNSLHWENEVIYTLKSGDEQAMNSVRIPEIFANSKLYFGKPVFNNTVNVQAGIQAHYNGDYQGMAYDPVIRQFHLQNRFSESMEQLVVDAFLDFRIDHVAAFLRYEHINQQTNTGYFITPYYPGQRKVFSLGISWMFFN